MKKFLLYIILGIILAIIFINLSENNKSKEPAPASTKGSQSTEVESTPVVKEIPLENRKKIYYELAEYQDKISLNEPDYGNLQAKAYDKITKRYNISKEKVVQIVVEGTNKSWPLPPPPK